MCHREGDDLHQTSLLGISLSHDDAELCMLEARERDVEVQVLIHADLPDTYCMALWRLMHPFKAADPAVALADAGQARHLQCCVCWLRSWRCLGEQRGPQSHVRWMRHICSLFSFHRSDAGP